MSLSGEHVGSIMCTREYFTAVVSCLRFEVLRIVHIGYDFADEPE